MLRHPAAAAPPKNHSRHTTPPLAKSGETTSIHLEGGTTYKHALLIIATKHLDPIVPIGGGGAYLNKQIP